MIYVISEDEYRKLGSSVTHAEELPPPPSKNETKKLHTCAICQKVYAQRRDLRRHFKRRMFPKPSA